MNFNSKLEKQFERLNIKVPTSPSHLENLYADYVELIALFSNENFVSANDILDRLRDEDSEIIKEDLAVVMNDDEIGSLEPESDEKRNIWVSSIFMLLCERIDSYQIDYPFEITDRKIKLKSELNFKHKFYLLLLISSNLNNFRILQERLTTEFELLSYSVLKSYLQNVNTIKSFGKNSEYQGNALQKIKALAADLNIEINEHELENIPIDNLQERGLDLIGWFPFKDKNPNMLVVLCQCTCQKEWYKKQNETRRFEEYFNFYKLNPIHAMFIPYSLINSNQKFYQSDEINNGFLLFERQRILEHLKDEEFYLNLDSHLIVDKCIEYEEDIV